MPLQFGDASTDRNQMIVFDHTVADQVADAVRRKDALVHAGYVVRSERPGEIALDAPARDPHMGVFRVLSDNGDDRIVWDRRDPKQVKEAFKKFKDFLKKGYTAFVTLASGKPGHKIEDFDPGLEEIVLVPSTVPG